MTKTKTTLALLFLAPAFVFASGCDQVVRDLTTSNHPPCLIVNSAECQPTPPPPPKPPITFAG